MSNQLKDQKTLSELLVKGLISLDVYILITLVIYVGISIAFYPWARGASGIIWQDAFIAIVIASLIVANSLFQSKYITFLRYFYIIPIIWLLYDQVHVLVRVVHPIDYDTLLIQVDRLIFGVDPTMWLSPYSNKFLTEYLQICYFAFYIMPIMHAFELWKRGNIEHLVVFLRAIVFCYMVSYLAYFAMPAIGPRFTLHDYSLLSSELPGILVTDLLRGFVEVGGGIPPGVSDPALYVNRDCMPSGHTMLTLVNIIMAFRLKSRYRYIFLLIGGSLIISTVYLRYHYVIDIIVGFVLTLILLIIEPKINYFVSQKLKKYAIS